MNIYIWEELEGLSHSYHDDGGAVVIAASWDDAVDSLHAATPYLKDTEALKSGWISFPLAEESVCDGLVIIFPNAGCC